MVSSPVFLMRIWLKFLLAPFGEGRKGKGLYEWMAGQQKATTSFLNLSPQRAGENL
jgi:hypothetical protein